MSRLSPEKLIRAMSKHRVSYDFDVLYNDGNVMMSTNRFNLKGQASVFNFGGTYKEDPEIRHIEVMDNGKIDWKGLDDTLGDETIMRLERCLKSYWKYPMPKLFLWAITGRVEDDDEDTLKIIWGKSEDGAASQMRALLKEQRSESYGPRDRRELYITNMTCIGEIDDKGALPIIKVKASSKYF